LNAFHRQVGRRLSSEFQVRAPPPARAQILNPFHRHEATLSDDTHPFAQFLYLGQDV
jgi:hypothetical protein